MTVVKLTYTSPFLPYCPTYSNKAMMAALL